MSMNHLLTKMYLHLIKKLVRIAVGCECEVSPIIINSRNTLQLVGFGSIFIEGKREGGGDGIGWVRRSRFYQQKRNRTTIKNLLKYNPITYAGYLDRRKIKEKRQREREEKKRNTDIHRKTYLSMVSGYHCNFRNLLLNDTKDSSIVF